ncbi:hypothetical protein DFH09DRAFT_1068763 [Mycena vulgaris]|nr:hypothetical protein DFH09DRAFT_1068763 [Mycena vulgaris]
MIGVPNFEELAALRGLGEIVSRTSQCAAGAANTYKAQQYAELLGDLIPQTQCLGVRARCYVSLGSYHEALKLVQKARGLWAACGITAPSTSLDEEEIHRLKTESTESRRINTKIVSDSAVHQAPTWFTAAAHLNLGLIDLAIQGDETTIRRNLDSARDQFTSLKFLRGAPACGRAFAALQLSRGEILTARRKCEESFTQLRFISPEPATYCLEKLIDISAQMAMFRIA